MKALQNKLFVAAALAMFGTAIWLALDLHRFGRTEVIRQFTQMQALLARQVAHEMDSQLQEYAADLHALTTLPAIANGETARIPAEVAAYYESTERLPSLALTVVDAGGAVVFSTLPGVVRTNVAELDFFKWARKRVNRGKVYVSPWTELPTAEADPAANGRVLLVRPLYRAETNAAARVLHVWDGLLAMTVDLAQALTQHGSILNLNPATHRLWIMDQTGTIVLQSEHPEMIHQNVFQVEARCLECHVSFDYARQMLEAAPGTLEYQLKDSPRKLAAYAPMSFANADWTVVVNTPFEEVTGFIRKSYVKMLLLFGLVVGGLGLAFGGAYQAHGSRVRAEQEAKQWQAKHRFELLIRQAEACYRTLFEQSPDGIVMLDPTTTRALEFNQAAHRQLGYSREEFASLRLAEYEAADAPASLQAQWGNLRRQGRTDVQTRHRTKTGDLRHVEVIAQPLDLADRSVVYCIYRDLTERKQSQELLERRTAQLEALHRVNLSITAEMEASQLYQTITAQALPLFQARSGALFLYRPEVDRLELMAQAGQASGGTGMTLKKREDLAGTVWATGHPRVVPDYAHWEGRALALEERPCATAMAAPIQWGNTFMGVLEISGDRPNLFTATDAGLLALFATQAAIAIKNASLLERIRRDAALETTLLHDVNHRVKNNVTRLLEMIRLERERAAPTDQALRAALTDLEHRLQGMEIIHTMLSQARWHPLSLNELATQIVNGCLSGSPMRERLEVTVKTPAEPLHVVPEQATAVALILNELVTNSLKHAGPKPERGHLEVEFRLEPAEAGRPRLRLRYRDHGPGWPEALLRGDHTGIGMLLIEASVRSPLRGELALRNDGGAVAEITFQLALAG